MTSTYDHRIIQGAESGSFLRRIDQLLQGEDDFYESVAEALEIPANLVTNAHPASASAPPLAPPARRRRRPRGRPPSPTGSCCRRCRRRPRCSRPTAPTATSRRTSTRSAASRKGDPALEPENLNLTPELMARIPASILRIGVEGETLLDALPRMRDAYCGDDRLPDRAPLLAPAADVAARDDRDRLAPGAARGRREARAALAADRGLPVRALPPEGLPGPEDVLDRGPRRDRADDRRDRHPGAPERRRGGRDRDGPPRPPQRPRPQPRSLGRVDPGRVRGRQGARPGEGDHRDAALGHRRRQVPPRRRGPVRRPATTTRSRCASTRTRATSSSSTRWSPAAPAPPRPSTRARSCTTTRTSRCRCCCTATPPSPARASSPRRSTCSRSTATRPAARSTSSPTTRSASPPTRRRAARPPTPATWRRASTARSSTSTPTTSRPASPPSGWRWPTASSGAATSSST